MPTSLLQPFPKDGMHILITLYSTLRVCIHSSHSPFIPLSSSCPSSCSLITLCSNKNRISQYDPNKQSLYYVHPQTNNVTWAHPLGPAYHAQETTRFHQIQQLQRQQFGNNQSGFYDSYNRQGGMGAGAGLAMGMMAGKFFARVHCSFFFFGVFVFGLLKFLLCWK